MVTKVFNILVNILILKQNSSIDNIGTDVFSILITFMFQSNRSESKYSNRYSFQQRN